LLTVFRTFGRISHQIDDGKTSFSSTFEPLKARAFILAIYMLVLFSYSCSDAGCSGRENEIKHVAQDAGEDDHSCADKGCAPFCFATCCNVHFYCQNTSQFSPQVVKYVSANQVLFTERFSPLYFKSIWQPPKTA